MAGAPIPVPPRHSAQFFFIATMSSVAATVPAAAAAAAPAKPPLKLHDHQRAAFILLLANFQGLARQQPDLSPRLDLDRVMRVSQVMRNMLEWCAASTTAANAVQEYYTLDHHIQRDKLPPLLAVIGVCIEAMGMPGWSKAVEAVQSSQRHFENIMDESKSLEAHVWRARLESSCTTMARELVDAMYNVQMRGRCEDNYSPMAEHDMHLMVRLRQATGVCLRWLVAENPGLAAGVRETLRDLLEESTRRAVEGRSASQAAVANLAEQVAERVMAGPMATMEARFQAVERATAETKSVAYAAEQIAAAADEAVASIKKSSPKPAGSNVAAKVHSVADAVKGLEGRMTALERKAPAAVKRDELARQVDAVAGLDGRVSALERKAPVAVKREELRALARQVDAMDDVLGSLSVTSQAATGRQAARLAAADSAIERLAARLEESEAAVDRLTARVETAEAARERLTAQVEWAFAMVHSHFAWRWNEVQSHWHAIQSTYGLHTSPESPPESPRCCD